MRYNCTIIDLYDRSVVASLNSSYINTELAVDTLKRAIKNEKPGRLVSFCIVTMDASLPHEYLWIFVNPRE